MSSSHVVAPTHPRRGWVGKEELCKRCDLFAEWDTLLDEAVACIPFPICLLRAEPTDKQEAEVACRKVRVGEVSRVRQCFYRFTFGTWDRRHFHGVAEQTSSSHLQRVASICPRVQPSPLALGPGCVLKESQNSAKRSPGPGCTCEHLRVLMDDQDTMDLLFEAATRLAQANLPSSVSAVLTTARLTALSKWDGGVRGVATGCTFHRLVARTLAKQFAEDFEQECSPFQHALSGTDCVGHLLRVATDVKPTSQC